MLPLLRRGATGAENVTVGFLYVGSRTDFGYNQGHAEGAAAVAKMTGVEILEEEMVPETVEVQKSMESMIELSGATIMFPTSYGYLDPHVVEVAAKYPDVAFFHCGGLLQEGYPANVYTYWANIDEGQYVAGVMAGHMTRSGRLGFVGAVPVPVVLRGINSFTLGARSVRPDITTHVIFTGDWNVPVKEAEAVNSLADQGCDVFSCDLDSPKVVVETCERRDVYSCGVYVSQAAIGPKGFLVSSIANREKLYTDYVEKVRTGQSIPRSVLGSFRDGMVTTSPYGSAASPEAIAAADAAKQKLVSGELVVYTGEIKTNEGAVIIPANASYSYDDPFLENVDWLVEGVVGSARP
jgi:simple sugar transport system substrate-binding protein